MIQINQKILEDYKTQFAISNDLSRRAQGVLAGGVTHDGWRFDPFPISIQNAQGAKKLTAEGKQLIDYWMGHGSLLFGHEFPPVVEAVSQQIFRGFHYGAPHSLQIQWAELICQLVPSAQRVRFTASGTEATLLAMRVARAMTGRPVILKFDGHFHGWHDDALSHFVDTKVAGLNPQSSDCTVIAMPNCLESVQALLDDEIAGVILEPGGGSSGTLAWDGEFLRKLRSLTQRNGTLLIFDEVVSGFRYSPGGVQQICGVKPDITVLGKILTGGLPGGAIVGPVEIMEGFRSGKVSDGRQVHIPHTGTFNANPLSAAAGIAMLTHAGDGSAQKQVNTTATTLVKAVNREAIFCGIDIRLYQQGSIFHMLIGACNNGIANCPSPGALVLWRRHPNWYSLLRQALLLEGVDAHPVHGWVSMAHTQEIVEETIQAFARAFRRLRQESNFPLWEDHENSSESLTEREIANEIELYT